MFSKKKLWCLLFLSVMMVENGFATNGRKRGPQARASIIFPIRDGAEIREFESFNSVLRNKNFSDQQLIELTKSMRPYIELGDKKLYLSDLVLGEGGFKQVKLGVLGKVGGRGRKNYFEYVAISFIKPSSLSAEVLKSWKTVMEKFPRGEPGLEIIYGVVNDPASSDTIIINPFYEGDLNKFSEKARRDPLLIKNMTLCFGLVATALAKLNRANLYHGDIKPPNLLYSWDEINNKINCVLADLDSVTDKPKILTPSYYYSIYELKMPRLGERNYNYYDKYTLALSFMEIIGNILNTTPLPRYVDYYIDLAGDFFMENSRSPLGLDKQRRMDWNEKLVTASNKIKDFFIAESNRCKQNQSSPDCPLFDDRIMSVLDGLFFKQHDENAVIQ